MKYEPTQEEIRKAARLIRTVAQTAASHGLTYTVGKDYLAEAKQILEVVEGSPR